MRDDNANRLLAKVMGWTGESVDAYLPRLQLLAAHKYDSYQRFSPGLRFIESLARWLEQFASEDRAAALDLVVNHLVFFSETELAQLVRTAYPDVIVQERLRTVASENGRPLHRVAELARHPRFADLRAKSLYLGLSDGARTNELRRAAEGEISNEQIWHAYELDDEKASDMVNSLRKTTGDPKALFNVVWLIDDFSGSGYTYVRSDEGNFKGKLRRICDRLQRGDIVDPLHHEVFLLLYVATRQAYDHIEYWAERLAAQRGFKPFQLRVVCMIGREYSLLGTSDPSIATLLGKAEYFDPKVTDRHILLGGSDGRLGFANCALPLVLSHNTPNNAVYLLWGPSGLRFSGLFPRASRHREY